MKEALYEMAKDFVKSINSGNDPISNGDIGLKVVKILAMSQESIKHHGKEIPFK